MNSGIHTVLPPDVSGAMRYERIAQLEAVLELRDSRRKTTAWTIAIASLVVAAGAVTWMIW